MPMAPDDWRWRNQDHHLTGLTWTWTAYRMPSPDWDHDHYEFCGTKFMEPGTAGVLHAGYATEDPRFWVCAPCFADFRERLRAVVAGGRDEGVP